MYLNLCFVAALVAFGCAMPAYADWLEEQSNATVSYMKVDQKDLTPSELELVKTLEDELYTKQSKRGLDPKSCLPFTYKKSKLVGNGDPHQNFYYQQVTGYVNCNGGNSISLDTSTSIDWSVSVSGAYAWISGGFAVDKSYSHGQTETFVCAHHDRQICGYQTIVHTAYTVQPELCAANSCGQNVCRNHGKHVVFFSPNQNQFGGCYTTGTDHRLKCRNEIPGCPGKGRGFWKKCGPKGGPGTDNCPTFKGQSKKCGKACRS